MNAVRTLTETPDLAEGDTIRLHGVTMVLAKELVRRPCCQGWERGEEYGHCRPEHGHGETVSFLAEIVDPRGADGAMMNLAAGERAHRVRNGRWVPEGDRPLWVVQGNALATWVVVTDA